MFYSKTCEYAIRVVSCLAEVGQGRYVRVLELSHNVDVPAPYAAKVCQALVGKGILLSKTGPHGGFMLAKEPQDLRLMAIVEAVEELTLFTQCVMGLEDCTEKHACPLHEAWQKTKGQMIATLQKATLKDVSKKMKHLKYRAFERAKLKGTG